MDQLLVCFECPTQTFADCLGPLIGGFVFEYLGWRWVNWVSLIASGVGLIMICIVPETYAPQLLRARAKKLREETGNPRWWSRYDERKSLWEVLKVNLSRPFVMSVTEPICIFWNLYVAVIYATLYLSFVAYPIVFGHYREWSSGQIGLSYVGIGVGSLITIALEPAYRRLINSHKIDPETGRVPPEAMVSVVCIASVSVPIGELIFAWTGTPKSIPWIAPILAGVPFGLGNTAVFIYASNYLVHSYGVYAASALAGNSVLRSVLGGVLPLAGPSMYASLGPRWAGTTLSLIEFALIPIPFIFYKYGDRIRRKSTLIRQMRADQTRLEGKRNRALQAKEKNKAAAPSESHDEEVEKEKMDV
jgi:Major Facilitator Superfamily